MRTVRTTLLGNGRPFYLCRDNTSLLSMICTRTAMSIAACTKSGTTAKTEVALADELRIVCNVLCSSHKTLSCTGSYTHATTWASTIIQDFEYSNSTSAMTEKDRKIICIFMTFLGSLSSFQALSPNLELGHANRRVHTMITSNMPRRQEEK